MFSHAVALNMTTLDLLTLLSYVLAKGAGKITFAEVLGTPYWAGAFVLAAIIVIALVALERWTPWRSELGRDVDGDLGGSPIPGLKQPRTPAARPI
jgi:hypothetical protein